MVNKSLQILGLDELEKTFKNLGYKFSRRKTGFIKKINECVTFIIYRNLWKVGEPIEYRMELQPSFFTLEEDLVWLLEQFRQLKKEVEIIKEEEKKRGKDNVD